MAASWSILMSAGLKIKTVAVHDSVPSMYAEELSPFMPHWFSASVSRNPLIRRSVTRDSGWGGVNGYEELAALNELK